MSSKFTLKGLLLILISGIVIGYEIIGFDKSYTPVVKTEFSSKTKLLHSSHKKHIIKHTQKIGNLLNAKIENISYNHDVLTLKATFVSSSDLPHANFKWSLPENVTLLEGELSGTESSMQANQMFEKIITLKADPEVNFKIHFIVNGVAGKIKISDVAQYNTLIQEELTEAKLNLQKRTEEDIKAKVVH